MNHRRALARAIVASAAFGALSFAWSAIGFLVPGLPSYAVEYSPRLAVEILGHFAFGALAGLASVDLELALVCGSEAVLIDMDHVLGAMGARVGSRLAHSALFVVIAMLLSYFAARRGVRGAGLAMATLGAFLSHLSYDGLSGDAYFPIFVPFSFSSYALPGWLVPLLELFAAAACASVLLVRRR